MALFSRKKANPIHDRPPRTAGTARSPAVGFAGALPRLHRPRLPRPHRSRSGRSCTCTAPSAARSTRSPRPTIDAVLASDARHASGLARPRSLSGPWPRSPSSHGSTPRSTAAPSATSSASSPGGACSPTSASPTSSCSRRRSTPRTASASSSLGQVRPSTSQTVYRADWIGTIVDEEERPLVTRAFRLGEIIEGEATDRRPQGAGAGAVHPGPLPAAR